MAVICNKSAPAFNLTKQDAAYILPRTLGPPPTVMDYPLKTADQLRQQLRSLRKKRGLTQARLGALIGVSQARVVEIEANPGLVSLQQVLQVLSALGAGLVVRDDAAANVPGPAPRAHNAADAPPDGTSPPAPRAKKGSW